jgi:hypothetical protein
MTLNLPEVQLVSLELHHANYIPHSRLADTDGCFLDGKGGRSMTLPPAGAGNVWSLTFTPLINRNYVMIIVWVAFIRRQHESCRSFCSALH